MLRSVVINKVVGSVVRSGMRSGSSGAGAALSKQLAGELEGIREAGTYKEEKKIVSMQAATVNVADGEGNVSEVLNFCANNYLGLCDHPELIEAAKTAMDERGFGLASVRFICGQQDIHRELEGRIAEFHKMDDSILYAACFDANAGIFEALFGPEDALISDELNHASIIDGMRLAKAQKSRFKHMDMHDLEEKLKAAGDARNRLIVTDGVFSMDGDIAPLDNIVALAQKYDAMVMVDECHATGFLGETGRGTPEYCGVEDEIDIVNSTLGKALGGGSGGYTTASQEVVDMLRQRSRPYLFSNTLAPPLVGAANKMFDMISNDASYKAALDDNIVQFRSRMTDLGFTIAGKDHAIAPVMLGDAKLAGTFAEKMHQRGIYVVAFSYPVVPQGKARIRVQLSAAHTPDQIDRAINAFAEVGKELGVIQ